MEVPTHPPPPVRPLPNTRGRWTGEQFPRLSVRTSSVTTPFPTDLRLDSCRVFGLWSHPSVPVSTHLCARDRSPTRHPASTLRSLGVTRTPHLPTLRIEIHRSGPATAVSAPSDRRGPHPRLGAEPHRCRSLSRSLFLRDLCVSPKSRSPLPQPHRPWVGARGGEPDRPRRTLDSKRGESFNKNTHNPLPVQIGSLRSGGRVHDDEDPTSWRGCDRPSCHALEGNRALPTTTATPSRPSRVPAGGGTPSHTRRTTHTPDPRRVRPLLSPRLLGHLEGGRGCGPEDGPERQRDVLSWGRTPGICRRGSRGTPRSRTYSHTRRGSGNRSPTVSSTCTVHSHGGAGGVRRGQSNHTQ